MSNEPIGRADYELGADRSQLKKDLASARNDIATSGKAAEAEATARSGKWGAALAAGATNGVKAVATATGGLLGAAVGQAFNNTTGYADFAKRMNEVFTLLPDASQAAMDKMSEDVKAFARETGTTTDTVIPALYQAISAGVPPENVFDFLRTANKGATTGVAQTKDEVLLLTAVTKGFGDTSQAAVTKAADLAQLMVKLGQTTIPELAASYAQAVPLAAALGISQEELAAASASLFGVTGQTSEVMTQERAAMTALMTQNPAMTAGLKKMGFETSRAAIESLGLKGTLDGLVKTTGGSTQALQGMLGSVEAVTATLALTGSQSKTFAANLVAMGNSAGTVDAGFARMDSGIDATARKWAAKLETMAIDLGGFMSKFGPLPLIIAQTFGPELTRLLGGAIGSAFGYAATSSAVTGLVKSAAIKVTGVYLAATMAGGMLSDVVASAWAKVPGSGAVVAAARMAGGTIAAVFSSAATLAILAAPVAVAWFFTQKDSNDRTVEVAAQQLAVAGMKEQGANVQALRDKYQELQATATSLWYASNGRDGLIATVFGTKDQNEKNLADVKVMMADVETQLAAALGEPIGRDIGQGWTSAVATGISSAAPAVKAESGALASAVMGTYATGIAAASGMVDLATRNALLAQIRAAQALTMSGVIRAAKTTGAAGMAALAQGITAARAKPLDAFNTLVSMLKTALTPMGEIARLHGELTSKALRDGLRNGDPAVRAQAYAVAKSAADRLGEIAAGGGKAGKAAMRELEKGIHSKIPAVRTASLAAKNAAVAQLEAAKKPAGAAGTAAGSSFASALRASINAGGAFGIAVKVSTRSNNSKGGQKDGGPYGAGQGFWVGEDGPEYRVEARPGYTLTHQEAMRQAAVGLSRPMSPGLARAAAGASMPSFRAETGSPSTSTVLHVGSVSISGVGSDVSPAAATRFSRQVLDEVARGFRQGGARVGITTTVRP